MLELGRTEEVIREMDKLANEDHTHNATEEELNVFRGNWWIRSNFVGSGTMPMGHRPDFKEALSTFRRLKNAEDQAYHLNWWQSSSSSWWQWQVPGGIPHLRHHRNDGLDTDGAVEPAKISGWSIYLWNESHNEFGAKVTVTKFGNSQCSLLSPTECVKSIPPPTENWLRKLYNYSMNINMSTEDKHETNHINNKYNDINNDAHKMHIT